MASMQQLGFGQSKLDAAALRAPDAEVFIERVDDLDVNAGIAAYAGLSFSTPIVGTPLPAPPDAST